MKILVDMNLKPKELTITYDALSKLFSSFSEVLTRDSSRLLSYHAYPLFLSTYSRKSPPTLSDPIEGVLSNGDGFHADIRKKEERPLANWTESTMKVAGADLTVVRGGSGKPLLMFHDELGYPGWMTWNEELAKDREIIIPLQPGFGKTPRIEWIRSFRDLGGFYANVVRELNWLRLM